MKNFPQNMPVKIYQNRSIFSKDGQKFVAYFFGQPFSAYIRSWVNFSFTYIITPLSSTDCTERFSGPKFYQMLQGIEQLQRQQQAATASSKLALDARLSG